MSAVVEFFKGWGRAGMAAVVACILAPFWIAGAVMGSLWWAFRDGFMETKK